MHLAVFGASGPTGRQVVRQALAGGHQITASTRSPDQFPLSSPRLQVVRADVVDPDSVGRVLSGAQAVISTYGVPYSRQPITVYSEGITNITNAMIDQRMTRLVCVTSTTVAAEQAPGESLAWRKLINPMLRNVIGRTLYDDMQRMEDIVQRSDLDWTIVRPAGLFNADKPTADYEIAARRIPGRATSRADLAHALIREATEPKHTRAILDVITRTGVPGFTTFIKEVSGN